MDFSAEKMKVTGSSLLCGLCFSISTDGPFGAGFRSSMQVTQGIQEQIRYILRQEIELVTHRQERHSALVAVKFQKLGKHCHPPRWCVKRFAFLILKITVVPVYFKKTKNHLVTNKGMFL